VGNKQNIFCFFLQPFKVRSPAIIGSASISANGYLQPGTPGGNIEERQNTAIATAYQQENHVSYHAVVVKEALQL